MSRKVGFSQEYLQRGINVKSIEFLGVRNVMGVVRAKRDFNNFKIWHVDINTCNRNPEIKDLSEPNSVRPYLSPELINRFFFPGRGGCDDRL